MMKLSMRSPTAAFALSMLLACGDAADSGPAPGTEEPPPDSGAPVDTDTPWDWTPEQGVAVFEQQTRTWHPDADGDGFGDPSQSQDAMAQPSGWVLDATDCDDGDPAVHPGAEEVCDGDDDDCDGRADLVEVSTWYSDGDGDGWGHPAELEETCAPAQGWVQQGGDCDPSDPTVHPEAAEFCDLADQDCDGEIDEGFDADGDGFLSQDCAWVDAAEQDCDDGSESVFPGAEELCEDGIDQDCDGWDLHCGFSGAIDLGTADAILSASTGLSDAGRLIETGDVNGDGVADILVATLTHSSVGGYLIHGPITADALLEDVGVALLSDATTLGAGRSIGMGDADGDGLDDLLVGCPYAGRPGSALLLGPISADTELHEADAFLYGDTASYTGHGTDLADMNGDGVADIAVGAWADRASMGSAYVLYGPVTGWIDLPDTADAVLEGAGSMDYLGRQVRVGGDVNGDGIADMMVSAPYSSAYGYSLGYVAVVEMPFTGTLSSSSADVLLVGESASCTVGISMAMGDYNGDGLDDMVMGASATSVSSRMEGAAYVVLGGASGALDLGTADVVVRGALSGSATGSGVACAHSDGDPYAELLVGAAQDGGAGPRTGAAYLFYGPSTGSFLTTDAHANFQGVHGADAAGQGVAIDDVNGDGEGDLLIGATGYSRSGGVFVLFPGT
jgi:hypothetical protein